MKVETKRKNVTLILSIGKEYGIYLDSVAGKMLSIDSDEKKGCISKEEAEERKKEIYEHLNSLEKEPLEVDWVFDVLPRKGDSVSYQEKEYRISSVVFDNDNGKICIYAD